MDMIVGVGDMKVSDKVDVVLTTYSLGSCVGVCLYDSSSRVGGLLHYMLPESSIDEAKARQAPFMFGDTGIPLLFKESYRLGALKSRLRVIVVGGAEILDQKGLFNIGKRNYTLLRKLFWKNNVMIDFEDVGGNVNRTLKLEVATGATWLKTSGNGIRRIA
jgi:chemotaxis protein CheD